MFWKFAYTSLLTFFAMGVNAQQTFIKSYLNAYSSGFLPSVLTAEGGYLITSYWIDGNDEDRYLFKVDSSGNVVGALRFMMPGWENNLSLTPTYDNGYIMAGRWDSTSSLSNSNILVTKLDSSCGIQWQKLYGATGTVMATHVFQTSDSGYIISGRGLQTLYLIRTDPAGDTLWTKIYGGNVWNSFGSAFTFDEGLLVAFPIYPNAIGAAKFGSSGMVEWTRSYTGIYSAVIYDVKQTVDKGYLLTGCTDWMTISSAPFVIRLDSSGGVIWSKTMVNPNREKGFSVLENPSGEFLVSGMFQGTVGTASFLVKLDANGDTLWTAGYPVDAGVGSLQSTPDGGFVFAGTDYSSASFRLALVKTDSAGETKCERKYIDFTMQDLVVQDSVNILTEQALADTVIVQNVLAIPWSFSAADLCSTTGLGSGLEEQVQVTVVPNPFHSNAILIISGRNRLGGLMLTLAIRNLMGECVSDQKVNLNGNGECLLSAAGLPPGFYFFELRDSKAVIISAGRFAINE